MGIATIELQIQRANTKAFIDADSAQVVLLRSTTTADGEGGFVVGEPAPLVPQRMRLIPTRADGAQERMTADGLKVQPEYTLMGLHTADMQRWDEFEHEGRRYQIVFVNQNRQYEVKGEAVYRG